MNRIKPRIAVRFHELDSMTVVWHGHDVAYCETAREVYLSAPPPTEALFATIAAQQERR